MTRQHPSKILKLATIPPFENEKDTLIRNYNGTLMHVHDAPITRALAKGLGVTFKIVMPEDGGEFGYKKPDGNWTGITGMLVRDEADLSVHGLSISNERREVVNFTYPLHLTDVTFITNKPEPHPKSFAIFDVFSFEVWIGIGLCLIMMSLVLYVLLKRKETYATILVDSIGCLLEKSYSFEVRQRNTALLLIHWFLGITVLIAGYKAVILSVITVPKMVGIHDVSDLSTAANENSLMCMTYKGGVVWQFLSNNEKFKSIGKCLNKSKIESLYGHQDFLKYPNKKAFIADRIDLSKFEKHYLISDDSFYLSYISIAYSKQFCCPKKLDSVVHRIVAADLYPKNLRDRDFVAQLRLLLKEKTDDYDDTSVKPLTLKDLTGAFLVLVIGHLCSFLIFIVEIISKRVLR